MQFDFQGIMPAFDIIRVLLDFGLIAFLIYCVLYFIRGTRAASILAGFIIALILLTLLTKILKFEAMNWLLSNFWTIFSLALVVIFQPELRRAFAQLGSRSFVRQSGTQRKTILETVSAVTQMSRSRTGALIVFERQIGMASIKNNAVPLEAKVNSALLQSIFYPNSPLHDGAVIIHGNTIEAAHAILPLTQQPEYASIKIGTRHTAAIGVTEETDAIAVVVSEETGQISIAAKGVLLKDITPARLAEMLTHDIMEKYTPPMHVKDDSVSDDSASDEEGQP